MLAAIKKNFYRVDAGNRLNLITLMSSDKNIEKSVDEHRF